MNWNQLEFTIRFFNQLSDFALLTKMHQSHVMILVESQKDERI